jgi:uncharacterized membrane protein YkoI
MNIMKRKTYLAALVALSTLVVGGAYASSPHEDNDALAISQAKVGLADAVAAAEQLVGGTASKAEYESFHGQKFFDVEVVKGQDVSDVKVGAEDGKVISVTADQADHDDSGDRED